MQLTRSQNCILSLFIASNSFHTLVHCVIFYFPLQRRIALVQGRIYFLLDPLLDHVQCVLFNVLCLCANVPYTLWTLYTWFNVLYFTAFAACFNQIDFNARILYFIFIGIFFAPSFMEICEKWLVSVQVINENENEYDCFN